jgi:hypothetical protein
MIAITHDWTPRAAAPIAARRAFLTRVSDKVEAYVQHRAKSAGSPTQWQHADDEIRRYRRLMHAGR